MPLASVVTKLIVLLAASVGVNTFAPGSAELLEAIESVAADLASEEAQRALPTLGPGPPD